MSIMKFQVFQITGNELDEQCESISLSLVSKAKGYESKIASENICPGKTSLFSDQKNWGSKGVQLTQGWD